MIKQYLSLMLFAAFLLTSCGDEDTSPAVLIGNAPILTGPSAGSSFVLTEATANDLFSDFTWTGADFGFDAGISYKLEMDVAGKNFAEAVTLGVVNALELKGITKSAVNNILLLKELPGEEAADIELRVAASVSADVPTAYSPTVTISVTPYSVIVNYPQLQVPGSYQGWDPANNTTIIFSAKSDGKFEGYIYMNADGTKFKYTDGPAWTTNWGDTGLDGTLDPNGDDISVDVAGVYKLNVDINALTHTFTKTDWGLIGSATPSGWDSDTDMTVDPANANHSITIDLVPGDIKFRANDAWDIDFGDTGANGSLEYGGDNIAIAEAGNYTITLILNQAKYRYTVVKN